MKKIISMGIASAVLALTAIAASADIVVSSTDKAEAGKTVTVTVTTTADIEAFGFTLTADGLSATVDDIVKGEGGMIDKNTLEDGSLTVGGINTDGWKAGSVLATITYTVTAEEGDVTVGIAGVEGMEGVYTPLTLTIGADGPAPTDPTDPTDPADPENPPMGVALAVVPAVLAGAAVVVAKKRK
ncbi:MAG: hypothetical protein J6C38_08685 [Oscillospiraceae bacterium]|nr:hypothetical protein [Oscillospiraceae bacterium]